MATWLVPLGIVAALGAVPAPAEEPAVVDPASPRSAPGLPERPADAPTGSRFAEHTTGWQGRARQRAAVEQLLAGNLPEFLRTLVPVRLVHDDPGAGTIEAVVWVMPDYLAIGSEDDFLYMPLTLPSAAAVANRWGYALPTRKIVDAVYAQAQHRFEPIPMEPGPKMRSSVYYLEHQRQIDAQRSAAVAGALVAGHKKDVVLTNRLARKAGRIAIYGWHRVGGKPIQPLSTVHGARYADYSHGVRLVWGQVRVEGRMRPFYEVLEDPRLAPVLTYEGTIRGGRKLMHADGEPWED